MIPLTVKVAVVSFATRPIYLTPSITSSMIEESVPKPDPVRVKTSVLVVLSKALVRAVTVAMGSLKAKMSSTLLTASSEVRRKTST